MDPISDDVGKSILRQQTTEPSPPDCGVCGHETVITDQDFYCPRCGDYEELTITNHARERWEERTACPKCDIHHSWDAGINFIDEGTRVKGDEFRYHHRSRCLLIRKNTALVTVEYIPETRVQIQRAVVRSLIADDARRIRELTEICNECNISADKLRKIAQYEKGVVNEVTAE